MACELGTSPQSGPLVLSEIRKYLISWLYIDWINASWSPFWWLKSELLLGLYLLQYVWAPLHLENWMFHLNAKSFLLDQNVLALIYLWKLLFFILFSKSCGNIVRTRQIFLSLFLFFKIDAYHYKLIKYDKAFLKCDHVKCQPDPQGKFFILLNSILVRNVSIFHSDIYHGHYFSYFAFLYRFGMYKNVCVYLLLAHYRFFCVQARV